MATQKDAPDTPDTPGTPATEGRGACVVYQFSRYRPGGQEEAAASDSAGRSGGSGSPGGPGSPGDFGKQDGSSGTGGPHRPEYSPWPSRVGRGLALLYLLAYIAGYFHEVYASVRLDDPGVAAVSSRFFTWREYLYGLFSLLCVVLLVARPGGRGRVLRGCSVCLVAISLFPVLHLWLAAPMLAIAHLSLGNYLLPLFYGAVAAYFFRPAA